MFALDEPVFSAAGGTGFFQIFCADGIFVQLGATNLGTNTLRIEYATNLFLPVWKPFPSPRFQLVFTTNSPGLSCAISSALNPRSVNALNASFSSVLKAMV